MDIFDTKITNWKEVNGKDEEIQVFRFSDLTQYYSEEELGDKFQHVPEKISELVGKEPGIIAFFPQQYLNASFAGSVVLAIMALPTIITVAEDVMRTTPRAMKETSLALGATQWLTIYKVIIPYSISGITSAVVLGIGGAIGETMVVLMVTGNAAVIPTTFFEPVRIIPTTIATELGEAPAGGAHYQALFLLGAVLFIITLVLSITVEYISSKRKI